MSGKKVDEKTISIPEVKKIMEQVKERLSEIDADESISHFQEITYDYVNKFSKMTDKSALQIKKFLTEKIALEELKLAARMDCLSARRSLAIKALRAGKKVNKKELQFINKQMKNIAKDFKKWWLIRNKVSRLQDNLRLFKQAGME
jgi:DNA-directed RNA polymerase subunit F